MTAHYESSITIKLPVFGGYLELEMEFNNGMIDLRAARSCILGVVSKADYSLGYTCPVGMARSTHTILLSLAQDGMCAEAQLMHNISEHAKCLINN